MKYLLIILSAFTIVSCNIDFSKKMPHGHWLGEMVLNDKVKLPFNFEVTSDKSLKILNAEEVILVDDVTYRNDSVIIRMPVFEGYFAVKQTDEEMIGHFINESLETRIPFKATFNSKRRFEMKEAPATDISGNWEVVFSPDSQEDLYMGKGIFQQTGAKVTGTFRTKLGDYRYLEGVLSGDELRMSAFDGSHAFLFVATVKDSTLKGVFYSGNHWSTIFEAKRNEHFELPDADGLTSLHKDYERFEFDFPDENGKMLSLADKQFENKVVVVQLMGSWCPNCLDESVFFSEYYKINSEKNIAFVALAFENAKSDALAFENIKRLKDRLGIEYPILLAQSGSSDKVEAQKKLPMLQQVVSYPTTIFIDKKGEVRKIHTGFNGPATGDKYIAFKKDFSTFLDTLMEE